MARRDYRRWRDWRINDTSGQSIRLDDERGRKGQGKQRGARNGWWWTLAARETHCGSCGELLLRNEKIAYHHQTRMIFCPDCARAERVAELCKPSRKVLKIGS
ncbi:MAG: hypothetical protein WBM00_10100 [Solirubrobacterales bacterium]